MADPRTIVIPAELLPADGRFGSGPSKVTAGRLEALAATGSTLVGTSHRQPPVKKLVRRVVDGLTTLFGLPDGFEIAIGNGGSAAFWDLATFALIEERSQHAVFGEFGAKFAKAANAAPWLKAPAMRTAEPGTRVEVAFDADVDTYAWTHNETSTGVWAPVGRPAGMTPEQLTLVDATSAAGGLALDLSQADVYYFAPQKSFASDGGLWITTLSPAAIERAEKIAASGRYIPEFFSLTTALKNTRADQTLNTPAVATLFLMAEQLDWMNANGGLAGMAARTAASAAVLYGWAERSSYAAPFVDDPENRSDVVGTIELDPSISKTEVMDVLRANGVVDLDAYRGIGANQLRIAMYPAVDASDVEALTTCIDYVVEQL
ncbi:phosphoserine transaminase [Nocardioides sp. Kera G14]|uniref:phosphoserine transaminase n=1 Tax=Nocardioides sp. Kera G14 TaxID=2884264 RepID=UPI001D121DA6|nr:phosphoserine transaminase [Nocardioides sp. Kera G14]UDY23985.1 phosphoserine transaminase [Nocardioides sp. Kera G14]